MTEQEWLACTDPWTMLHYLFCNCSDPAVRDYFSFEADLIDPDGRRRDVSERKLRLLYCACCRRVSPLVPDSGGLRLIEVAERAADGLATEGDLEAARQSGKAALQDSRSARREVETWVALANSSCLGEVWVRGKDATVQAALAVSEMKNAPLVDGNLPLDPLESQQQTNLLRCIIGNPFRPVPLTPAWRTAEVLPLAQAAYEHRELPAGTLDATRLAVLADALEEAGCDQADLLGHLRGPGPHVRGCWAVDLVLGKE